MYESVKFLFRFLKSHAVLCASLNFKRPSLFNLGSPATRTSKVSFVRGGLRPVALLRSHPMRSNRRHSALPGAESCPTLNLYCPAGLRDCRGLYFVHLEIVSRVQLLKVCVLG